MTLDNDKIVAALGRGPATMEELVGRLELDAKTRHRLRKLVAELVSAGGVEKAPGGRFRLPGQTAAAPAGVVGRIRVHPAGFGFVERDDGADDVFVPARFRGGALDGDRVRLSTWLGYKGTEGKVEEVIERGRAKLTGRVRRAGNAFALEPDDPRVVSTYGRLALDAAGLPLREGESVVAEITRYDAPAAARALRILGEDGDPRTEVAKVIACADIPDEFPEDALDAAKRTPTELRAEDLVDRIDLRDRPFASIDPETARDFDDAVCLEERGAGWRLWVAIADVSHYVRPGSALDREARIRGCSVYLPDRAIPMLPHELSAEMCSLKPEVDRLAMVVRMDVDAEGAIHDRSFCAAVIRSRARLDYPGVAAALAGDFRGARARYQEWADPLERMQALARKMRARRRERGALELELAEPAVILDEDDARLVRDVRRSKSTPEVREAYQLVEEFMLAANEAVAELFAERGLDAIWRVHEPPSEERLETLAQVADSYGLRFDVGAARSPKGVQALLASLAGKPYERPVSYLVLRSLRQAVYDVVNVGHFGLASPAYVHFTSPIRRYPDLIVHRLLKVHLRREGLASGGGSHPPSPARPTLAALAAESSQHERRAVEAEREVVDIYRAVLMRDRVGEVLAGTITGVTNFGLFVECAEPFVEGMIRLDSLGDSFEVDEGGLRVTGRRSGRKFALGDAVRVKVEDVSVARRRIDFKLVSEEPAARPKRGADATKPGTKRGARGRA
ncbi:MAG TPA: ribonuclease R [Haliangiales bacterium]|nr:ribonuclease R [Haliangiales bacterium]